MTARSDGGDYRESSCSTSPSPQHIHRDGLSSSPYIGSPLMMACVFAFERSPNCHDALRRALGRRGGIEGFAAAAVSGQVDHGVPASSAGPEDDFPRIGSLVPLNMARFVHDWELERVVIVEDASDLAWSAVAIGKVRCRALRMIVRRPCELGARWRAGSFSAVISRSHISHVAFAHRPCFDGASAAPRSLQLCEGLLRDCGTITEVDLSALAGLTAIGDDVLVCCVNLAVVKLARLSSLTSIGDSFAAVNPALVSVDLAGLSGLTSIGKGFLEASTNLAHIDLAALSALTTVGAGFLFLCPHLTCANLSGLTSVTSTGPKFLERCRSLESLDLSALTSLTSTGNCFARECTNLSRVDLSGLTALTTVGESFLARNASLTRVDLSALRNVTSISQGFLCACPQLRSVDGLSRLTAVTSASPGFLNGTAIDPVTPDEAAQLPQAIRDRLR